MNLLADLIAAGRQHYIATHRCTPDTLALGRWDARELARVAAQSTEGIAPSALLRLMRGGVSAWGAEVKIDGRIGRMPASLWWLP